MRNWIFALLLVLGIGFPAYAQDKPTPEPTPAVEQEKGLVSELGDVVDVIINKSGPAGGIIIGALLALVAGYWWDKRPGIIKKVDSVQDILQKRLEERYGPKLAAELRDVMEGIEDKLLSAADVIVSQRARPVTVDERDNGDALVQLLLNRQAVQPRE